MTATARRRATYDDVVKAPEGAIAQVIYGVLHTEPRPAIRHANASSNLGVLLGAPFRFGAGGPGGWVIYDEPELHLGCEPDIVVPDLAGWRRERLAELAEDAVWTSIAPDWSCEVLSPSTQAIDRADDDTRGRSFRTSSMGFSDRDHLRLRLRRPARDPRLRRLRSRAGGGPAPQRRPPNLLRSR